MVRPLASALACGLALVAPAMAEAQCRLALLLAVDISSSVDVEEDMLQRGGLATALASPEVMDAILSVPGASVAIAAFEWSGRYQQDLILDWVELSGESDIAAAASVIGASKRSYAEFPTALGHAVGHAAEMLSRAPRCDRQTIDISGDGVNNEGFPPGLAYETFDFAEVTVNGLAIQTGGDDIEAYYRSEVIRGIGSFVEVANGFDDFERAMRKKLVRETQAQILGALSR